MFFKETHGELLSTIEVIGASFAVYEYSPESNNFFMVSCNTLYEDILGFDKKDAINKPIDTLFPRYISEQMYSSFTECKSKESACESEFFVDYKASERWWRSIVSPIVDPHSPNIRIIQTCVEITEKKKLEKQLDVTMKRYEAVVQTAYDGIITIDENQDIKLINSSAQKIFGMSESEGIGMPLTELLPHKYRPNHNQYVSGFRNSKVDSRPMQTRASVRGLRRDGTEFSIEVTISKINVDDRVEMTAVIRDISERNKLMEELVTASQEDSLTNLYNRRQFTKILTKEISRAQRYLRPFSLFMLDIDYFKNINDKYGHDAGDEVLVRLSGILKHNTRESDSVCRWGGEEFLVLMPETHEETTYDLAEKLRQKIAEAPFEFNGVKTQITVSIGITTFRGGDIDVETTVSTVDELMYQAKHAGRNTIIQG